MYNKQYSNALSPYLPLQLVCVIIFSIFFGSYLNETLIRILYTFSLFFKFFLSCILPLLVFTFVAKGILSFNKSAPLVLAVLVGIIFFSNALVALISYLVALLAIPTAICGVGAAKMLVPERLLCPIINIVTPLWISSLSILFLLAAIVVGLVCSYHSSLFFVEIQLERLKIIIEQIMYRIIIPFLPLYVFGITIKMHYEGMLGYLFDHYSGVCLVIISYQFVYVLLSYYLISGFSLRLSYLYIKNIIPSYIAAFGTMSSTAVVPLSTIAAEKNTKNYTLARVGIPIMANIHLIGNCIVIPLLICATLLIFKGCLPSFLVYLFFIPFFCIVMFGAAGIPGGGILVTIPLLKTYFGFTEDMIAMMISLYLLLDPFGTAINVAGDGSLIILVNLVLKKLKLQ